MLPDTLSASRTGHITRPLHDVNPSFLGRSLVTVAATSMSVVAQDDHSTYLGPGVSTIDKLVLPVPLRAISLRRFSFQNSLPGAVDVPTSVNLQQLGSVDVADFDKR